MAPKRKASESDQPGADNPLTEHDRKAEAVTASGDYIIGYLFYCLHRSQSKEASNRPCLREVSATPSFTNSARVSGPAGTLAGASGQSVDTLLDRVGNRRLRAFAAKVQPAFN